MSYCNICTLCLIVYTYSPLVVLDVGLYVAGRGITDWLSLSLRSGFTPFIPAPLSSSVFQVCAIGPRPGMPRGLRMFAVLVMVVELDSGIFAELESGIRLVTFILVDDARLSTLDWLSVCACSLERDAISTLYASCASALTVSLISFLLLWIPSLNAAFSTSLLRGLLRPRRKILLLFGDVSCVASNTGDFGVHGVICCWSDSCANSSIFAIASFICFSCVDDSFFRLSSAFLSPLLLWLKWLSNKGIVWNTIRIEVTMEDGMGFRSIGAGERGESPGISETRSGSSKECEVLINPWVMMYNSFVL